MKRKAVVMTGITNRSRAARETHGTIGSLGTAATGETAETDGTPEMSVCTGRTLRSPVETRPGAIHAQREKHPNTGRGSGSVNETESGIESAASRTGRRMLPHKRIVGVTGRATAVRREEVNRGLISDQMPVLREWAVAEAVELSLQRKVSICQCSLELTLTFVFTVHSFIY